MKPKSFVAFSCPHVPLLDEDAFTWLLGEIDELEPDYLINLGDTFEADSSSRWPSEYDWTIKDEYEAAQKMLERLGSVTSPECKKVMLAGNHDANITALGRFDKRIRDVLDPREHVPAMREWQVEWDYEYDTTRTKGVFMLNDVLFMHGFEANISSDAMQAILMCNPFGLLVSGHTHMPKPVTQVNKTQRVCLPYWYANAGCMRNLDPDYVSRKRHHDWGHALVHGEVNPDVMNVRSTNGLRRHAGWDAQTKIYRYASDG